MVAAVSVFIYGRNDPAGIRATIRWRAAYGRFASSHPHRELGYVAEEATFIPKGVASQHADFERDRGVDVDVALGIGDVDLCEAESRIDHFAQITFDDTTSACW